MDLLYSQNLGAQAVNETVTLASFPHTRSLTLMRACLLACLGCGGSNPHPKANTLGLTSLSLSLSPSLARSLSLSRGWPALAVSPLAVGSSPGLLQRPASASERCARCPCQAILVVVTSHSDPSAGVSHPGAPCGHENGQMTSPSPRGSTLVLRNKVAHARWRRAAPAWLQGLSSTF